MLRRVTHVLFVCLSVLMSPMVSGQTSAGSLAGSVFGPDGKAVAGAALMVRNDVSGDLRTTVTDSGGRFSVGGLTFGAYTIEIFVPGFETVRRAAQLASDRTEEIAIKLTVANITESVTVSAALPEAAVAAPSQASLTARSAQSLISNEYIRNYTSPISDYSQVLQMAPGTYSVSSNGPGLGDTKTFFRGFKDGQYSMTYDGIPFNDTNDPTHHSWVFFPAQTIGSTVFDRSPGSASSIGPSTYGGSVGLISRSLGADRLLNGTVSYGSFNTRMFDVDFNTGRFGTDGKSRLMIDAHEMRSDGYQTFNFQQRDAFSAKYSYQASANTSVTAFRSCTSRATHRTRRARRGSRSSSSATTS
jgi:iron complex outermembrane receptor protein